MLVEGEPGIGKTAVWDWALAEAVRRGRRVLLSRPASSEAVLGYEGGGDVHLARNKGTAPVQLYVTFLARAGTTGFLTEAPEPAACRGL